MVWEFMTKREPMAAPTSFSPQILLMIELEAGLAEGPRTATTPLDMIWHTVNRQEKDQQLLSTDKKRDVNIPRHPVFILFYYLDKNNVST